MIMKRNDCEQKERRGPHTPNGIELTKYKMYLREFYLDFCCIQLNNFVLVDFSSGTS